MNYGIVIGTSHHEPLMRAHDEWRRYGKGKWNYDSNEVRLKEFWKEGMQRATNEKIVSVGMRGDGDEPMTRETATALLERIVKDQRKIIEEVTRKPAITNSAAYGHCIKKCRIIMIKACGCLMMLPYCYVMITGATFASFLN